MGGGQTPTWKCNSAVMWVRIQMCVNMRMDNVACVTAPPASATNTLWNNVTFECVRTLSTYIHTYLHTCIQCDNMYGLLHRCTAVRARETEQSKHQTPVHACFGHLFRNLQLTYETSKSIITFKLVLVALGCCNLTCTYHILAGMWLAQRWLFSANSAATNWVWSCWRPTVMRQRIHGIRHVGGALTDIIWEGYCFSFRTYFTVYMVSECAHIRCCLLILFVAGNHNVKRTRRC